MEGKHILVVDDEKEFVELIESLLSGHGHRVSTARNGAEGLSRLKRGDPDLMVLDMNMPRMGGVELCERIASEWGRPRFPVIVLTGVEGLADFFSGALIDAFLTKPVSVAALLKSVEALLGNGGRESVWLAADPGGLSDRLSAALGGARFAVRRIRAAPDLANAPAGEPPCHVFLDASAQAFSPAEIAEALRSAPFAPTALVVYTSDGSEGGAHAFLRTSRDRFIGPQRDPAAFFAAMRETWRPRGMAAARK